LDGGRKQPAQTEENQNQPKEEKCSYLGDDAPLFERVAPQSDLGLFLEQDPASPEAISFLKKAAAQQGWKGSV
jgi:hypothetical protein